MEVGRVVPQALRLIATIGAVACLLVAATAAPAAHTATLTLRVTFTAAGAITVTLPDGTPVGSTSGSPTVIPAGYYTLLFFGPGECINLPLFELRGPGVNINDDMLGGETDVHTLYATFLPNSTYTWHSDRNTSVVFTFRASSDVVGTPSSNPTGSGTSTSTNAKPTSQDITGSAIAPFRGTLTAGVSALGRLTLAFKGRSVTSLKAGRYTVAVSDKSATNGFLLQKLRHTALSVTSPTFIGKRSLSVTLTPGKWLVLPRLGKATYSIAVN